MQMCSGGFETVGIGGGKYAGMQVRSSDIRVAWSLSMRFLAFKTIVPQKISVSPTIDDWNICHRTLGDYREKTKNLCGLYVLCDGFRMRNPLTTWTSSRVHPAIMTQVWDM